MNNHIKPEEYLYHYTTEEGLLGILESNCLWATHYKFLNDDTEITSAREHLKNSLLQPTSELEGEYKKLFSNNDFKMFYDYYRKFEEYEFYITSFCKKGADQKYIVDNGLLSQWRGYGGNGGFAIEFDEKKLKELIEETDLDKLIDREDKHKKSIFFPSPVVYSNEDYSEKFKIDIEKIINEINSDKMDEMGISTIIDSWIKCITSYKSEGFNEENEFRIVASLDKYSQKIRRFRGEIPYIELFDKDLPDKGGKRDRSKNTILPIKKIIVGPHKDKEARAARLRVQLAIMGRDIPVTISETPFVGR